MFVILNEVKNLMISTESIIEILRLSPQNDIMTQSLMGEGGARGNSVVGILVIIWYLVLACLPAGRGFGYY